MNSNKPYIVLDLETTGVDVMKDRIIEICIIKVNPDGVKEAKTRVLNPTIPIPKEASEVHGFTDEMVADKPTFKSIAKGLHEYIKGMDVVGYCHSTFDIPMLIVEFERAGISFDVSEIELIDVYKMYCHFNSRKLVDAYRNYTGKELDGAHGAAADSLATLDVFSAMIEKHELKGDFTELASIGNDVKKIDPFGKLMWTEEGEIALAFGKNKGLPLKKLEKSYIDWLMRLDDMPNMVLDIIKSETGKVNDAQGCDFVKNLRKKRITRY